MGGFFLSCENFLGMFDDSFPACLFVFFLKWRLARGHLSHTLGQDQSTVAQRAETTVAELSLTCCMWVHFPWYIGSHIMAGQHSQPTPTSLGQGSVRVRCNLPSVLLAEWPGSFTYHCGYTGSGTDSEEESAHKVNSGEENSLAAPAGIRTRNLSITSPGLYQ